MFWTKYKSYLLIFLPLCLVLTALVSTSCSKSKVTRSRQAVTGPGGGNDFHDGGFPGPGSGTGSGGSGTGSGGSGTGPGSSGTVYNPCTPIDEEELNSVTATCGSDPNTCDTGIFHGHPPDTATEHRWTCRHIPHSRGEIRCDHSRENDHNDVKLGMCGETANSCFGGEPFPLSESESEIIWSCRNQYIYCTPERSMERFTGEIWCSLSVETEVVTPVDVGYEAGSN